MPSNTRKPKHCTIYCNGKYYEEVNSEQYARHLARTKSNMYKGEEWSVEFTVPKYTMLTYINGKVK